MPKPSELKAEDGNITPLRSDETLYGEREPTAKEQRKPSIDIYDPAAYETDETDEIDKGEVKLKVKLGRPFEKLFVRAHHDPRRFTIRPKILKFERKEDFFIVMPELHRELENDLVKVRIEPLIDLEGQIHMWPIPIYTDNDWHSSARDAIVEARSAWIRIIPDQTQGRYRTQKTTRELPDPTWPDVLTRDLIEAGFKGRIIYDRNHDALTRLR